MLFFPGRSMFLGMMTPLIQPLTMGEYITVSDTGQCLLREGGHDPELKTRFCRMGQPVWCPRGGNGSP